MAADSTQQQPQPPRRLGQQRRSSAEEMTAGRATATTARTPFTVASTICRKQAQIQKDNDSKKVERED